MIDEADLGTEVCTVDLLLCVEREEVAQLLMLVYGTTTISFFLSDDLAFVLADVFVVMDVLTGVETETVHAAVPENGVLGNAALNVGVAASTLQDAVVVTMYGIQDIAHAAFATQVRIALSSGLKAGASGIFEADKLLAFLGPFHLCLFKGARATLELALAAGWATADLLATNSQLPA
jgi:hypothetical protein